MRLGTSNLQCKNTNIFKNHGCNNFPENYFSVRDFNNNNVTYKAGVSALSNLFTKMSRAFLKDIKKFYFTVQS